MTESLAIDKIIEALNRMIGSKTKETPRSSLKKSNQANQIIKELDSVLQATMLTRNIPEVAKLSLKDREKQYHDKFSLILHEPKVYNEFLRLIIEGTSAFAANAIKTKLDERAFKEKWKNIQITKENREIYNKEYKNINSQLTNYAFAYERLLDLDKYDNYTLNEVKIKQEAIANVEFLIEQFIAKNVEKIFPIITQRLDEISNIEIEAFISQSRLNGFVKVHFIDKDEFMAFTQVVIVFNGYTNPFARYPTTFHNVRLGADSHKMVSQEWLIKNISKGKLKEEEIMMNIGDYRKIQELKNDKNTVFVEFDRAVPSKDHKNTFDIYVKGIDKPVMIIYPRNFVQGEYDSIVFVRKLEKFKKFFLNQESLKISTPDGKNISIGRNISFYIDGNPEFFTGTKSRQSQQKKKMFKEFWPVLYAKFMELGGDRYPTIPIQDLDEAMGNDPEFAEKLYVLRDRFKVSLVFDKRDDSKIYKIHNVRYNRISVEKP